MNALSLNIRGVGESHKVKWIRTLKRKHKVDFIGLQETRIGDFNQIDVAGCWGSTDFDMAAMNPTGRSGGLLSIWDPQIFNKLSSVSSRHFIATTGDWNGFPGLTTIVNVYAPQSIADKRALWRELGSLKSSNDGIWVFLGDFNAVRKPEDRFNSRFCKHSASDFNNFISASGLNEFQMGGRKFTFLRNEGFKLSKIDRFLVCSKFLAIQAYYSVTALPRTHSDHSPLLLKPSDFIFKPPPFRFFNSWISKPNFDEVFDKAWTTFRGFGTADRFLLAKFKHVKQALRNWRMLESLTESGNLEQLKRLVDETEILAESRTLSEIERTTWKENKSKILELEHSLKLDLQQKAKAKWISEGDENSKYFHGIINSKSRKNKIHGLSINGTWNSNQSEILSEVHRHFSNKFKEKWPIRPQLRSQKFKALAPHQAWLLEAPFTMEELKSAVWCCGGEKAPGPDGYTFKLIKHKWEVMKSDIWEFVKFFERTGTFTPGCNSAFVTLIPKVPDPLILDEYRPISLIGSLYKIVAKMLALRLKMVIGSVVDEVQTAYISDRNILDGPLIINEVYSWAKRTKRKTFLFKVDFEKAFDSVNWNYLDSIMEQMQFGAKWRHWIQGCLSSSQASVLVNGTPSDEYPISKGVKQGDPLSPFLFILAMEGLNQVINNAKEKDLLTGTKLPNNIVLSHLFYADDAIFVGDWNVRCIKNLSAILKCFHLSSGLKVNFSKSRLFGINTTNPETLAMANVLGCSDGAFPFTYLGVPVGANMGLKKHWKPVIDKFQARLSKWKAQSLSFGGRITLIKSVLNSLPTYYMSLFKAPQGTIDILEKIRRKFLWGGGEDRNKIHWVNWTKIIAPIADGGLGIGTLKAQNLSLLIKWWWRLLNDKKSLWKDTITGIHKLNNKPANFIAGKTSRGVWCNIAKAVNHLQTINIDHTTLFRLIPGSNVKILFWKDIWCGNIPFQLKFPTLYNLEKIKCCTLLDRFSVNGFTWNWKHPLSNLNELDEILSLYRDIESLDGLVPSNYGFRFLPSSSGDYLVSSMRKIIDSKFILYKGPVIRWTNLAPLKARCFVWRAMLGRIPVQSLLHERGVSSSSQICVLCGNENETVNHLFIHCAFSKEILRWLFNWCGIRQQNCDSVLELIQFAKAWGTDSKLKDIWNSILYCYFWCLWLSRNDKIFKKIHVIPAKVEDAIMTTSFSWCKNRASTGCGNWAEWSCSPFNHLKP